jgi:hypothetical protein
VPVKKGGGIADKNGLIVVQLEVAKLVGDDEPLFPGLLNSSVDNGYSVAAPSHHPALCSVNAPLLHQEPTCIGQIPEVQLREATKAETG